MSRERSAFAESAHGLLLAPNFFRFPFAFFVLVV
jgi:hypothetical protein